MTRTEGETLLTSALTDAEWKRIPSEITKKIYAFASAKFDEFITEKARSETAKFTAEQAVKELQENFERVNAAYEETRAKFDASVKAIEELELQLSNSVHDVAKLQSSCSRLEEETAEIRKQRNLAVDEKEDMAKMVERRTNEIQRLQDEMNVLTKQLESAISAKCEALAKINEVEVKEMTIDCREKKLDQERQFLNGQIEQLTQDLHQRSEELYNIRRDNTVRCIQLETKLTEKNQEYSVALENIKTLTEVNNNHMQRAEELIEQLAAEKERMIKTQESFDHELAAQKKLTDLYKQMSDDNVQNCEELSKGLKEVKANLDEAIEKYGDLETKFREAELAHEEILEKKTEYIDILKKELEQANEVLANTKIEYTEKKFEEFCPTGSLLSKNARPGSLTMSQMITEINRLSDELADKNEENAKLNIYLQQIQETIQEKAPILKRQREEYESAVDNIEELSKANDALTSEIQQLRVDMNECKRSESAAARENERMKKEVLDLSRQVCHLLREVEMSRIGGSSSMSTDTSDSNCSADIISKNLVTFSDIQQLQATNQKLLAVVRELSTKQEESEGFDPSDIIELNNKLESLRTAHSELLEQQDRNTHFIKKISDQRDLYKNMYFQAKRGEDVFIPMELRENTEPQPSNKDESDEKDKKIRTLEEQVDKLEKDLKFLKEESDNYRKEKAANEAILVEQMEKIRGENSAMMNSNGRLLAKCETNDELFKTLKNNTATYKKQVESLEDRCKIYSDSIIKHETTISYLREQTMDSQTKLSKAEVRVSNLEKENALLKDAEKRLARECEHLKSERHSINLLVSNIELVKATLERKDAEGKMTLDNELKDAHRELAAMRRRFQEEQDRYRTLSSHLESQTKNAQSRMEEEKNEADKLRKELSDLREDFTHKSQQIEDLSKKLKMSMFATDTPDSKQLKEMQKSYENAQTEIEGLRLKLRQARENIEQQTTLCENSEKQLKELLSTQNQYKESMEKKMKDQEKIIADLQEKCSELEGELSVHTDGQEAITMGMRSKIRSLEDHHRSNTSELENVRRLLEEARAEIQQLTHNLEAAEDKYSREMMLHSADLQAYTALKEDLTKLNETLTDLTQQRDQAHQSLEESKAGWATREELYAKEKEDYEKRFKDMDKQNMLLLDQLQSLNTQLSIVQSQQIPESINSSIADTSLNRSITEEDSKSSEQLLKIIKYLRNEKEIASSKCDILEAEHMRMKAHESIITKQLEDLKAALEVEKQKSDSNIVTQAKHAEVLRKVETLNAITDSNRSLRIERDNLLQQMNQITARTNSLEEQLAPLQERNKELTNKAEAMQTENITLRGEATRWRQRANLLIEKSNRTSPEDWKRLQGEKENLAKLLTVERSNNTRMMDENNNLKLEKNKLEEQVRQLRQQQHTQKQELDNVTEQLGLLRAQIMNLTQELTTTKDQYGKLKLEHQAFVKDSEAKSTGLQNNMIQIRKIAKKYKTQCEDNTKELEQMRAQLEAGASAETLNDEIREQLRQEGRVQVEQRVAELETNREDLVKQVENLTDENENLKKQIFENEKGANDKVERFKCLFKSAKDKIISLTAQLKDKEMAQGGAGTSSDTSDAESRDSVLQSTVEQLEKEKDEILAEKEQEKEKLTAEIDALTQRVNQLQRQLGLQQGSKPSTSSGPTEKSTTEPPTANIKPMAGHSTNTQTQSVSIQPWRSGGEPPLASIRPMSMQLRTVAVPPTSQSPSAAMVPPQQVHTTGSSNVEAMSSSPTSSHTDYAPATSSASSAQSGQRQTAVPPTQSSQDAEDEDASMQAQAAPQQQAVALVSPRVEPLSCGSTEQGTSSAGSSNAVTTTQAGLKRPREADTDSCQAEEQGKSQQQTKRTRVLGAEAFQGVSESGLVVEYQVPTSSQRDHEEETDAVIVVESDEDGDVPDEGEGADDEPDDADAEGYDMEENNYPEQEMNYEDDCQDVNLGNEVEVIEDSSEVPNQSEHSAQEGNSAEENSEQPQSEAISSGSDGNTGITVSQASTSHSSTLPSLTRTRQVAPLSRGQQSHLLLPHGLDEGGDDGIVPSTPTLFVPRRSDGFGEAVSSPHVPTSGRFTFNEPGVQSNVGSNEVIPEHALELSSVDDNSTGRSVPSTPLQSSPQEYRSGLDESQSLQPEDVPLITVSGAVDEPGQAPEGSSGDMGPPSIAGPSSEQQGSEQVDEMESEDGVTSEGEKPPAMDEGEEEGREAEASTSPNVRATRSSRLSNRGRPNIRHLIQSRHSRGGPTPIVWGGSPEQQQQRQHSGRGELRGSRTSGFSPRAARRNRGRTSRPYNRY